MKKVLLTLLAIVVVAAICVVGLASTKPNQMHIERSVDIAAPPAAVFAVVNDFHCFAEWSPWQDLDPAMKTDLSGAPNGRGAVYHWAGNDKAGEGRMTIDDSTPDSHIGILLEFLKPFAATNRSDWTFKPAGAGTHATWSFDGPMNMMFKVMSVFMDLDKMTGDEYAKGLGKLKRLVESAQPPAAPADSTAAKPRT